MQAHQARHTHARLHINMPDSLLSYRIVLVDIAFIQGGGVITMEGPARYHRMRMRMRGDGWVNSRRYWVW